MNFLLNKLKNQRRKAYVLNIVITVNSKHAYNSITSYF